MIYWKFRYYKYFSFLIVIGKNIKIKKLGYYENVNINILR